MTDATMTSPALKVMRKSWHKGTFLWHTGLYLLLTAFVMQFVVIGTTEFIVGESAVEISKAPLYSFVRRTYGMWRTCYDIRGLAIPGSTEIPGCVRPKSLCTEIFSLYQLNQAFGIAGVFFTLFAIIMQILGIARRGSCYVTIIVTLCLGAVVMGLTMTIWAVVVGLKNNTFCSDSFPVLAQVNRADYHYSGSFVIAVIDWIVMIFYLLNQIALAGVISGHSKSVTEQVDAKSDE